MQEETFGWNTYIGYLIGWREHIIISYGLLFIVLIALGTILRLILYLLPKHFNPSQIIPESAFIILLGILIGIIIYFANIMEHIDAHFSTLDPDFFFSF